MQEARLFESRGNFSDAIRSAKQTVMLLQSKDESLDLDGKILLAETLVTCGKWIAEYKVEPADSVLANYLRHGATCSLSIYELQRNEMNARRAMNALFAQHQLVSDLFDSLSARVKSSEWDEAGKSLKSREEEFKRISEEIARRRTAKRDNEDLVKRRTFLRREIDNTTKERQEILRSVEEHRKLAMESILSALLIADVGEEADLSKHVYRFVALWFSSYEDWTPTQASDESDETTSKLSSFRSVDEIVEGVEKLSSFRFVPLASQLFSRIEKKNSNNTSFQNRLQQLTRRMCVDHPYHCVVQLLALSESSNPKVQLESAVRIAAAQLIEEMKRDGSDFVRGLIDSYEKLTAAYIYLAKFPTKKEDKGKQFLFRKVCKTDKERLDQCLGRGSRKQIYPPCVLTKPPSIRPDRDYFDGKEDPIGGERIQFFKETFSIAEGGNSRPKIVVCVGSKDTEFKQLVKWDDVRMIRAVVCH
jgi:ataxia telangiectasia mutated family protein